MPDGGRTHNNLIEDEYLENAAKIGEYTLDALHEIMMRHPHTSDVRGIGLMIGVEFVKGRKSKAPDEELRDRITEMAFERGLILLGCGKSAIRFAPPLSVSKPEVAIGADDL